ITELKWESTRGIGYSFGYNKMETEEDYLKPDELIRLFVDIISKNGNLLLNVGPMADGTIPELQKKAILGLGKWLEINGESIYGTRPWKRAEGKTQDDIELRFTQKSEALYIHLLDKPKKKDIIIKSLEIADDSKIQLLGTDKKLDCKQMGEDLHVKFPKDSREFPIYVFKITPKPI
ncbi:MAG: alpha-L-fucosidase, partial [Candidatus Thorarchaeota archaeon]